MAGLNTGGRRPAGDDGTADPRLAAVLARYAAGQESERAMLTALAGTRLLVPLVERPAGQAGEHAADGDHGTDGCDHQLTREMAFPMLIGRDGRPALLAFTSLAALAGWQPQARPVPTPAGQVWGSAVDSQCAVVIDVAGPVPVAVDGARLAALAAGEPPPDPHTDPDVRADVAAALAGAAALPGPPGQPAPAGQAGQEGQAALAIAGADLAAGRDGTDLAVRLLLRPAPATELTGPQVQQAVQQAAEAIAARLAGRLRRGIEFSAAAAPASRPGG